MLRTNYLVEEVLHEFRDADVVIVSVDEEHLLEVFELGDGVVAVPHCLAPLLTHDALGRTENRHVAQVRTPTFTRLVSAPRGLTDADVGLQDHADVVGSVSDGQRDRVLLGGFDQLHDLENAKKKKEETSDLLPRLTRRARRRSSYLRFLQRRHPTAEHGAAVAADFQEDLFVVPRVGVLLGGPHHSGEGGSVDDQPVVGAVARQTGPTEDPNSLRFFPPHPEKESRVMPPICRSTVLLRSNRTSWRLCSSVRLVVSSRICVLRRNSLLA
ncbi:hypothetical protein EYF80_032960 [Liparis tanakae]|uniref:Uncharacterized protein n=1 Tax=Liparis tanakae TaxID=230148 RepID=A0A4Z2GWB6_9TELE|nr:hypothetical protein EYF80_032960 [Liparis tanakae]